jgi:hypothetical protein
MEALAIADLDGHRIRTTQENGRQESGKTGAVRTGGSRHEESVFQIISPGPDNWPQMGHHAIPVACILDPELQW